MSRILALLARLAGLRSGIAATLRWVFAAWYRPVLICLIIGLIWQWFAIADLRDERDAAEAATSAIAAARDQDHANVAKAAAAAELRAQRNLDRVSAEYVAKMEESAHAYQVADARYRDALAGFLRRERANALNAAANPGGPGATALPGHASLPGADVPDATFADLPTDPALTRVRVPLSDLERCAQAFARLEGLIAAWQSAAAVDVNDSGTTDGAR